MSSQNTSVLSNIATKKNTNFTNIFIILSATCFGYIDRLQGYLPVVFRVVSLKMSYKAETCSGNCKINVPAFHEDDLTASSVYVPVQY
jgi:hypothetical protein